MANRNTNLLDAFSNTDEPYGDCMLSMSASTNRKWSNRTADKHPLCHQTE